MVNGGTVMTETASFIDKIISALKNVWSKLTSSENLESVPKDTIPDVDDQGKGEEVVTTPSQEKTQPQIITPQEEEKVTEPEKTDVGKEKPTPEELSDSHAGPPYTIEQVDNPEITYGFDTQPLEVKFPENEREFFRGTPGQDIIISIIDTQEEIYEFPCVEQTNTDTYTISINQPLYAGNSVSVMITPSGIAGPADYIPSLDLAIQNAISNLNITNPGHGISYDSSTNVLTFSGGPGTLQSISFDLTAAQDGVDEDTENLVLTLSGAAIANGTVNINPDNADVDILDAKGLPPYSVYMTYLNISGSNTVYEGYDGSYTVTLDFLMSGDTVNVKLNLVHITTEDEDFTPSSGLNDVLDQAVSDAISSLPPDSGITYNSSSNVLTFTGPIETPLSLTFNLSTAFDLLPDPNEQFKIYLTDIITNNPELDVVVPQDQVITTILDEYQLPWMIFVPGDLGGAIGHDETPNVQSDASDMLDPLPLAFASAISGLTEIGHAKSSGEIQFGGSVANIYLSDSIGNEFSGESSGLYKTQGNEIFLYADNSNDNIVWGIEGDGTGADSSGTKVFAVYLDEITGKIWLSQFEAIEHPTGGASYDESISIVTNKLYITLEDGAANKTISTNPVEIGFQDDGIFVDVTQASLLQHDETEGVQTDADDVAISSIPIEITNVYGTELIGGASKDISGALSFYGTEDGLSSSGAYPTDGVSSVELTTNNTSGIATGLYALDSDSTDHGTEIYLFDDGNGMIIGHEGNSDAGTVMFVLYIESEGTNSTLHLAQYAPIWHSDTGDYDEVSNTITSGIYVKAIDGDGDETIANTSFQIAFQDDGIFVDTQGVTLIHDETVGDQGNNDVGAAGELSSAAIPDNYGAGFGYASKDVSGALAIYGSEDGSSNTPYGPTDGLSSLLLTLNAESVASSIYVLDPGDKTIGDTDGYGQGEEIYLFKNEVGGNTFIEGRVGDDAQGELVFVMYLNSGITDGELTSAHLDLVQYKPIWHSDPGDGSGGTYDESATITSGIYVKAIDGDGDEMVTTAPFRVEFQDDGILVDVTQTEPLVHDETYGMQNDDTLENAPFESLSYGQAPLDVAKKDLSGVINFYGTEDDTTSSGWDPTDGVSSFSLAIKPAQGEDAVYSGLHILSEATDDTAMGNAIFLFEVNGIIEGRVGGGMTGDVGEANSAGDIAFVIQLDENKTLWTGQYLPLWHDTPSNPDEPAPLSDKIYVQAIDGDGDTHISDSAVLIEFQDDAPIAVDDNGFATDYATPLDINFSELLANDTTGVDVPPILSVEQQPNYGTVTIDTLTQQFTYTPNSGYSGVDSFEYRLSDADGDYSTATVTINVGEAPSLRGVLVINEVGLGVGTSPEVNGQGGEENVSYFELRSTAQSASDIKQAFHDGVYIEFIDADGYKQVIDLQQLPNKAVPAGKEYLVIFEDGIWGKYDKDGDLKTSGTWTSTTGLVGNWNLVADTSGEIAVNLVQLTNPDPMVLQTIDALVANGVGSNVSNEYNQLTNYNQLWSGPEFNGSLTEQMMIFSRVFSNAPAGVSPHDEGYGIDDDLVVIDTNKAADWTTNNDISSVGWFNRTGFDPNPEDITDDLDPRQASGQDADAGQTFLYGDNENNILEGGRGPDFLYSAGGDDKLDGGDHNDYLDGGTGEDELYGGSGADKLYGGAGDDYLVGGSGEDEIYGGAGNDTIVDTMQESSSHIVDGGDGVDTVKFTEGGGDAITLDLTSGNINLSNVEYLDMKDLDSSTDTLIVDKASVVTLGGTDNAIEVISDPSVYHDYIDVYVKGDDNDLVKLKTGESEDWVKQPQTITTAEGVFDIWVNGSNFTDPSSAVIAIQQNVDVVEEATS
jgi:hypothetical protein